MTTALDRLAIPLAKTLIGQYGTRIAWTRVIPGAADPATSATGDVPTPKTATIYVHGVVEEFKSNRPEDFNLKQATCPASEVGGNEPRLGDTFDIGGFKYLVLANSVTMASDDPVLYVVLLRQEVQVTK